MEAHNDVSEKVVNGLSNGTTTPPNEPNESNGEIVAKKADDMLSDLSDGEINFFDTCDKPTANDSSKGENPIKKADDVLSDVSEGEGNYFDASDAPVDDISKADESVQNHNDGDATDIIDDLLKDADCDENAENDTSNVADIDLIQFSTMEKPTEPKESAAMDTNDEFDEEADTVDATNKIELESSIINKLIDSVDMVDEKLNEEEPENEADTNNCENSDPQIEQTEGEIDEEMLLRSPSTSENVDSNAVALSETELLADSESISNVDKIQEENDLSKVADDIQKESTVDQMEVDCNENGKHDEEIICDSQANTKNTPECDVLDNEKAFDLFDALKANEIKANDDDKKDVKINIKKDIKVETKETGTNETIGKADSDLKEIKLETKTEIKAELKSEMKAEEKSEAKKDNENNLLEAMSESPRSNMNSCEESMSSFHDESESNADMESKDGNNSENDNQNECVNEKSNDVSVSGQNDDCSEINEVPLTDLSPDDSIQLNETTNDGSVDANVSDTDLAKTFEQNISETEKVNDEIQNVISIDDDEDDTNGAAQVNLEKTVDEIITTEKRLSDEAGNDEPPAKRKRLESNSSVEQDTYRRNSPYEPTTTITATKESVNENEIGEEKEADVSTVESFETNSSMERDLAKSTNESTTTIKDTSENVNEKEIGDEKGADVTTVDLDDDDIVMVDTTAEKTEEHKNEKVDEQQNAIEKPSETAHEPACDSSSTSESLLEPSTELTARITEEQLREKEANKQAVNTTVPIVPIEERLTPQPEKVVPRKIALDFMKKFKKNFSQMTRKDLEELVMEKIVEAIVHKSEYSELKQKTENQEQKIQTLRTKIQEMTKQYRDLDMVHTRVQKDLEARSQGMVTPIKITRAVGLQVCLQKQMVTDKPKPPILTPLPPKTSQRIAAAAAVANQSRANQATITQTQRALVNRQQVMSQQQRQQQLQQQQKAKQIIHQAQQQTQQRVIGDQRATTTAYVVDMQGQNPGARRISTIQMPK